MTTFNCIPNDNHTPFFIGKMRRNGSFSKRKLPYTFLNNFPRLEMKFTKKKITTIEVVCLVSFNSVYPPISNINGHWHSVN